MISRRFARRLSSCLIAKSFWICALRSSCSRVLNSVALRQHRRFHVYADDGVTDIFGEQGNRGAACGDLVCESDADPDHGAGIVVVELDAEGLLVAIGEGELGFERIA